MKRNSTILLQVVIVLIGIGALVLLLWEPHFEGRNVNATLFEIYLKDPFLALVYIASIPFFVALYQAIKVLQCVGKNKIFSPAAVKALRTIKYCAHVIVGFAIGGEAWLFVVQRGKDDIAGGVFMGLLIIFGSGMVAIVAKMFEQILQNAVNAKSESMK